MTFSDSWFHSKSWSVSGNKADKLQQEHSSSATIVEPKSAQEISQLLSTNQDQPIAVVCGGHSSSNVSTWPCFESSPTIILDLKHMSDISVDKETFEVTVGGGTIFAPLAETCAAHKGALPIGTGGTVGVCGYALNGGISGYFGRRLGMLGQRVTKLEIVLASGEYKTLTATATATSGKDDQELFRACLGAGSAMGVVTSLTLQMEDESCFRTGGSMVFCGTDKETAKPFLAKALRFMKETILPLPSTSMEIVIVSNYTVICNFMFYDTFDMVPSEFVQPLRDCANECNVPILADGVSSHKSWFDAASSLWEVIAGLKGDPMVRMDHCIGTQGIPSYDVDNFILEKWIGDFLSKAALSLVEIRSLGGAATERNDLPTGNAKCAFFADMIVSYDASTLDTQEKLNIHEEVHDIIAEAKAHSELLVDFSGTHCQSDDPIDMLSTGDEIFGSRENHEFIRKTKARIDPNNRFRFHPFSHLM